MGTSQRIQHILARRFSVPLPHPRVTHHVHVSLMLCSARRLGVLAARGVAVARLRSGDAVLGFAHAPLAHAARGDARLLGRKPPALSFEAACSLPTVWSTVHVAVGRAALRSRHGALVHAVAGGIGGDD